MTIKDILTITGGNTKVMIFSTDKEDRYIRLWHGIVDDIHCDWKRVRCVCTKRMGNDIYDIPQCIGVCSLD